MQGTSGNAHDDSQMAVLGEGVQNNYFGAQRTAEPLISLSPPVLSEYPLRGRHDLLATLLAGWGGVHVVHGLGGCGKTRIAAEVAARLDTGTEAWWLSAATPDHFVGGMRALGRRLGLASEDLRSSDFVDRLWELLNNHERRWFLIIDNADDTGVLSIDGMRALQYGRGWLRPVRTGNGAVVVTSRDGEEGTWGTWCSLHRVSVVSPGEGADILLDRAPKAGDRTAARALAERLGGLPLALSIAGSYLAQTARHGRLGSRGEIKSFDEYRSALDGGGIELIFPGKEADFADRPTGLPVGATWNLSLRLLENRGTPAARPLLSLLAQFADTPIPYEDLLTQAALCDDPDFTAEAIPDALDGLSRFSLVEMISPAESEVALLTLHPLIRELGVSQAPARYVSLARSLLTASIREAGDPRDLKSWRYWDAMKPHIDAWIETEVTGESSFAVCRITVHLLATALAVVAEESARRYLAIFERSLDPAHPDVLSMQGFLASSLISQRRYDEATTELTRVLDGRRRVLGGDHPDTLHTRLDAARIMRERARYSDAEAEMREILAIQSGTLGPRHGDVLETRRELAMAMAFQGGRFSEAEEEFRDLLATCGQAHGPSHRLTLDMRSCLASVIRHQGRFTDAEDEYRSLLAARQRVLGPEHPATLETRNVLAWTMKEAGQTAQAEDEYRRLLAAMQRVLGLEHPATLSARNNLAAVFWDAGRPKEAGDEYQELLAAAQRVLGPEHPTTLIVRNNVVAIAENAGELQEAEDAYRELLATERRALGPEHLTTFLTRQNLAETIRAAGRLQEAEDEFRELLATERRALGAEHPRTLTTRAALAWTMRQAGQTAQAEDEYRQVLAARQRVLGPEHPSTLTTRNAVAVVIMEAGRLQEAEDEYRQVLAAARRVLGPEHPTTLIIRGNLALVIKAMGRTEEARTEASSVLAARERVLGRDHPDTKAIRSRIDSWSATKRLNSDSKTNP